MDGRQALHGFVSSYYLVDIRQAPLQKLLTGAAWQ
jgi:hypothetical protein